MEKSFRELVDQLARATRPEDVFGALEDGPTALKQRYRELATIVHPDHNPGHIAEASRAFQALQEWHVQARRRLEQGVYGRHVFISAKTRRHHYTGYTLPLRGDVCDLYPCDADGSPLLLKVARSSRNNDLLQAEAQAIRQIDMALADQPVRAHFPDLVESFQLRDTNGYTHYVNVLRSATGTVSLEEVMRAYPNGIAAADAAWMFNRMLVCLGLVHGLGIVHGAVVPAHILIRPDDHNGMLIDWCYSVPIGKTIKAVSPPHVADYPPEVSARQAATAATDIFMAAGCMVRLLGGDPATVALPPRVPRPIAALLRACLLPSPWRRPDDAWGVYDDVQEILGDLYGPPTFRPFVMPGRAPATHRV
jgi:serine/threonine protein kinase